MDRSGWTWKWGGGFLKWGVGSREEIGKLIGDGRFIWEVYNSAGSGSRRIVDISCDRLSMYHANLRENVAAGGFPSTHCKG